MCPGRKIYIVPYETKTSNAVVDGWKRKLKTWIVCKVSPSETILSGITWKQISWPNILFLLAVYNSCSLSKGQHHKRYVFIWVNLIPNHTLGDQNILGIKQYQISPSNQIETFWPDDNIASAERRLTNSIYNRGFQFNSTLFTFL